MKLKYVLFSGLLLSVGFTACTNEDFTEVTAPVNTSEAIALGEGYTITVNNGAATRAAFDSKYTPSWEEGDKLGAAWFHQINKDGFDEEKGEVKNNGCGPVAGGTFGGFYSNATMNLTAGAGTLDGTFTAQDNSALSAGAYVLYYPHNGKSTDLVKDALPVELKSYDIDCANPLKNINDNMFAYSTVKFLEGEYATNDFTLSQVPVLVRLKFTPGKVLNNELVGGIAIENIVIEANDGTNSVLATTGKITAEKAPNAQNYNKNDWTGIVKYASAKYNEEGMANNLFITVAGSDNDNYKLLKNGEPTKNEFIFSILPFSAKAKNVVIKVVTEKGVYKAEYDDTDTKFINEFNNAVNEGSQVAVNVTLDMKETDNVIYTARDFKTAWDEAVAAGDEADDIVIGTDLELTEPLAVNDGDAKFTVKSDKGAYKLTVPSMDVTMTDNVDGVTFDNSIELVVKDALYVDADAILNAKNLTAKTVTVDGKADLTVKEIEDVEIVAGGVLTVAGVAGEESTIASIENRGTLTPGADLTIEAMDSDRGTLVLNADFTNNGEMTLGAINAGSHKFINNGTVTLNGAYTGTFENNAGATLNINATQTSMNLTNAAADATKKLAAGVVNVAVSATLQGDAGYIITNNGIINVAGALVENAGGSIVQNSSDDARIIAQSEKAGIVLVAGASITKGYIVILVETQITNPNNQVAYNLTDEEAVVPASAGTVFVNTDIDGTWLTTNASKNLIIYDSNIELADDADVILTGTFTVAGDATVSLVSGADNATLTLGSGANKIDLGASLTLCKGLTFKTGTNWTQEGTFTPNGATVSES